MAFEIPDPLYDDYETRRRYLSTHSPEALFANLNAQAWIERNVVYVDGIVDIERTAWGLDITVIYDTTSTSSYAWITGVIDNTEPLKIHISDLPHRLRDRSLSFGHELGHLFMNRKLGNVSSQDDPSEEAFCDYFGLCLAIPTVEIEAIEEINETAIMMLSERLGVSHGTVIEKMMRLDRLPRRVAYDVRLPISLENTKYSGKVMREVICLECIENRAHDKPQDILWLPTFDLTAYDVSQSPRDTPYHGHSILNDDVFYAVNERYEQ